MAENQIKSLIQLLAKLPGLGPRSSRRAVLHLIKNQEIVLFCGGGIAATLNYFVLYHLGFKNLKLYDNSMSEWAANYYLPIQIKN